MRACLSVSGGTKVMANDDRNVSFTLSCQSDGIKAHPMKGMIMAGDILSKTCYRNPATEAPKLIRMDITDNCNLRCPMCTIHDGTSKSSLGCMDLDAFKKNAGGLLADIETVQIGNIAEPMLHAKFSEFIDFIRSKTDAIILVQSNGTMLSNHIRAVNENRCHLNISLDSFREDLYARIRVGSRIGRTLAGIGKVDASKVKVKITPVWMNCNIGEFDDLFKYCLDNGFYLAGNPMSIREANGEVKQTNIDQSLWFNREGLVRWKEKYFSYSNDIRKFLLFERIFASTMAVDSNSQFVCNAHREDMIILACGSCKLCFMHDIGNLNKISLYEMWVGDSAERFRNAIDSNSINVCRSCDYRTNCLNPFVDVFRNHVNSSIYKAIPEYNRKLLSFESGLSDMEKKHVFESAIIRTFKIDRATAMDHSEENAELEKPSFTVIERSYKGYNIILFDLRYFALPEKYGEPTAEKIVSNAYGGRLISLGLDDLKREIDKQILEEAALGKQKALFVCNVSPEKIEAYLGRLSDYEITLLKPHQYPYRQAGRREIECAGLSDRLAVQLKPLEFDLVIIPYEDGKFWESNNLETFAGSVCSRLLIMFPDGTTKLYKGEDVHRVGYNKAYLASMFKYVPPLRGMRILEIGCSDGLACDLLLTEGPESVDGIDILESTGCSFRDPRISYSQMDASSLSYEDESFDFIYSIATLEHCKEPLAVLDEMKRALRPGGYAYVQAAPLYHSPFGHHMFGYFDHYPWIHLRLTPDEIIRYARENGIDKQIELKLGLSCEEYVHSMLNLSHINGKLISEYCLEQFVKSPDIEVIHFARSYEGEELLSESTQKELDRFDRKDLVTHGFELVFKMKEKKSLPVDSPALPDGGKMDLAARKTSNQLTQAAFSFLLPTRGRPDLLNRFFQSVVDTTSLLDELEIVLAIDDDDMPTRNVTHDKLNLKKVIVSRGMTMGELNNACFRASSGRFVMLVNDDIILRTKGWDDIIRSTFAAVRDDIALIHVNDLLFREVLCTFPLVSRRACLEIGLCPTEYSRYKIDDHIYDVYSLLALMGHKRIIYLPDVVFEHDNYGQPHKPGAKHTFKSVDNKVYVPNKEIIERDEAIFLGKFEGRKQEALKLARLIEGDSYAKILESREKANRTLVMAAPDPYSYRREDFKTRISASPGSIPRTTVAIVTADIRKDFASKCVSLVKQHTSNFDLMVLDNGGDKNFSHSREMNKVLRTIDTDLLVFLDDDVFVEPGWLEGLAGCLDQHTGVVAPMHKDGTGKISFTGAFLSGDVKDAHEHTFDIPDSTRPTQVCCSAAILIDMRKCGHILMNEAYRKYFFDINHALEIWEAGYRVVCTPKVTVTHLGGATASRGTQECNQLWSIDGTTFDSVWVQTGRLARLEWEVWKKDPYLWSLAEIRRDIDRLRADFYGLGMDEFVPRVARLVTSACRVVLHDDSLLTQRILGIINEYIGRAIAAGASYTATQCVSRILDQSRAGGVGSGRFKVLADLEKMRDSMDNLIQSFRRIQLLKQLAIGRYHNGDLAGAEEAFLNVLVYSPRDLEILVSLGRICYEGRRFSEAMKYNETAIRLNPNETEAWVGIGLIALSVNDANVLEEACQRVQSLNPHHPGLNEMLKGLETGLPG